MTHEPSSTTWAKRRSCPQVRRGFSLQPRFWQSSLLLGALDESIHGAFNLRRDRPQELCLFSSRDLAVGPERFMRQARGQI